jgi:Flp pilus assembly protein CpaB
VKVLAIDQIAGEGDGKPTVAKAVTVGHEGASAKILLATNVGKLSLILGRPVEVELGSKSAHQRAGYRSHSP